MAYVENIDRHYNGTFNVVVNLCFISKVSKVKRPRKKTARENKNSALHGCVNKTLIWSEVLQVTIKIYIPSCSFLPIIFSIKVS